MLSTIARAGRILELFDSSHPEWGVTEVAEYLDISKASASEHLASLALIGLLRKSKSQRYCLGWPLFSMSLGLRSADSLLAAGATLEKWSGRLGESVNLAVLANDRVVILSDTLPAEQLQVTRVGRSGFIVNPCHSTSVGKVLLAYESATRVDRILGNRELPRLTEHTFTDVDLLKAELDLIRGRGFAYDFEETIQGRCCIAAPIRDAHDDVIAAVSLVTSRVTLLRESSRYTRATMTIADEIASFLRNH